MESGQQLTATLHALLLFDIAEEIDLTRLHAIMGTSPSKREPAFRHPPQKDSIPKISELGKAQDVNHKQAQIRTAR